MELRYYQKDAISAVKKSLKRRENALVVIPTGGGKTAIIANVASSVIKSKGRVIILTHVKELIEQSVNTLKNTAPELPVGIYCAGFRKAETEPPIIVASIKSVYQKADQFKAFSLVIIDEAHLVPPNEGSCYRQFINDLKEMNPNMGIVGLTATPFRTGEDDLTAQGIFTNYTYVVSIEELIEQGFLSNIKSYTGSEEIDTTQLNTNFADFKDEEVRNLFQSNGGLVLYAAMNDLVNKAKNRKKILIFCQDCELCTLTQKIYREITGEESKIINKDTPDKERDAIIKRFREGDLRTLINCQVLTTGFDAPNVDCVVILRATISRTLYVQMTGRGLRIAPGKEDCLVLDYGQNIKRFGPIDCLNSDVADLRKYGDSSSRNDSPSRQRKQCPNCGLWVAKDVRVCPGCNTEFEFKYSYLDTVSSDEAILKKDKGKKEIIEREIIRVVYNPPSAKRGAPEGSPRFIRVDYHYSFTKYVSEWLFVEYEGSAREKFEDWLSARVDPEIIKMFDGVKTCAAFENLVKYEAIANTNSVKYYMDKNGYPKFTEYNIDDVPTLEMVNEKCIELQNSKRERMLNGDSYDGYY